jgi:hypothetical protein
MGSLSNLYISSSFQSLLHFGSDNTASIDLTEIEDGFGNGLGFYLNSIGSASLDGDLTVGGDFIVSGTFDIEGKVTVNDNVRVNGNLEVSGATNLTGSLVVSNNITASNASITNDLNVGGTLFASKVVTLIESSSIIFSSGSNILGDETSDIQTLIGLVRVSGSSQLTGSMGITGELNVLGNISSSTISGIGNVTTYSQSVDARLDVVEATASLYIPFSQSVDNRLDFLEGPFSSSVSSQLIALEQFTASIGLITSQSFNTYTASTDADLAAIHQTTSSLNAFTASQETKNITLGIVTQSLNAFTASQNNLNATFSTTGSNNFVGNQTITGSLTISSSAAIDLNVIGNSTFSGSVRGNVNTLSISSNTASMDCSLGNFFILNLQAGINTRLQPTNILPGETVSLRVNQNATPGTISYPSSIKFADGSPYTASITSGAVDVLSFISFDNSTLFGAAANKMV